MNYVIPHDRATNSTHRGTHRGCKIYANRHGGKVINQTEMGAIEEAAANVAKLQAADEARKAEDILLARDYLTRESGYSFLATRTPRYELRGELARAMMAFTPFESRNQHWCGSWNGGTFFTREGTYYGWLSDDSEYMPDAVTVASRIHRYAVEAWRWHHGRGHGIGMRLCADLMAASALVEQITYIRA